MSCEAPRAFKSNRDARHFGQDAGPKTQHGGQQLARHFGLASRCPSSTPIPPLLGRQLRGMLCSEPGGESPGRSSGRVPASARGSRAGKSGRKRPQRPRKTTYAASGASPKSGGELKGGCRRDCAATPAEPRRRTMRDHRSYVGRHKNGTKRRQRQKAKPHRNGGGQRASEQSAAEAGHRASSPQGDDAAGKQTKVKT